MATEIPFTEISFFSLLAVFAASVAGYFGSSVVLNKNSTSWERFAFIWLAFDGLIHFCIEGPFLYLSLQGRTINSSTGPLADMWREYARADARWGTADPTIVSLEILTVLGVGPLCFYSLYLLWRKDPSFHLWFIILSTAELYGGWMTFCPEWLTGNPSLDASNVLDFWVYLVFLNILWVVIPLALMVKSYQEVINSFKVSQQIKSQ